MTTDGVSPPGDHRAHKIGVVGVGHVGVAAAFAMFLDRLATEIVLVDLDRRRAAGEAADLMHGQGLVGRVAVRAGDYADLAGAQLVVVSAGVGQRPGESRLDLLQRNVDVFRVIAAELDRHAPSALVIVATNPVDLMTDVLQRLSMRPPAHIVGTGTSLDTSRLRALVGAHYDVDPRSVHGYVLGEHGDSEFVAWSTVEIGGTPLPDSTVLGIEWDPDQMADLEAQVRTAAYGIIEAKGYTNWAIGVVIDELAQTMLGDRRTIQPVSVRLNGEYRLDDVCLSIPCRLGARGVERTVTPPLTDDEVAKLQRSAAVLTAGLAGVVID